MAEPELLLELARFVERISAIARTGLAFKPDGYDSERYEELLRKPRCSTPRWPMRMPRPQRQSGLAGAKRC